MASLGDPSLVGLGFFRLWASRMPMGVSRDVSKIFFEDFRGYHHQEFQVPKMEVLNLIFGYFGGGFSLT